MPPAAEILFDAGAGEHAAVADSLRVEALLQRAPGAHGQGSRVVLKDLHRHRTALAVGQKSEDDCSVMLPITRVTGDQRTAALEKSSSRRTAPGALTSAGWRGRSRSVPGVNSQSIAS